MKITPTPTDDEAAAIVVAIELSWPRASSMLADDALPRWRFSGRWWAKPVPAARRRP